MAEQTNKDIATPVQGYIDDSVRWELLHDLIGGTRAMRAAGKKWLPQEPREKNESYASRLSRSFLYGGYADTLDRITGKPFSKPVQLDNIDTLPKSLQGIENDVDGSGTSLTAASRSYFLAALTYGLTHVLIDFPTMKPNSTLADELNARPYFVHIQPPQLIGWQTTEDGRRLTQIRFTDQRCVPDGLYGSKTVNYIRLYTETEWSVWKEVEKGVYVEESNGVHTFGRVPLFTLYFDRSYTLRGCPPLEELAWMNLAHWQSFSDQRNILRVARTGVLFASGFQEHEVEKGFAWGPTSVIASTNPDAKLQIIENSGRAVNVGEKDLEKIEERMEVLGMQPLISRTNRSTAAGKIIDESRTDTDAQAWTQLTQDFLYDLYVGAATWVKETLPKDFAPSINNDFGISQRAIDDAQLLLAMRRAGDLDRQTFLQEIKRRNVISEGTDVATIIDRLNTEDPPIGGFTLGVEEQGGSVDAG